MSNDTLTYVIAAGAGAAILLAYVALILVPAWTSYSRAWERVAASFLTLYMLAAILVAGAAGGAALAWFWDQIWA